MPGVTMRKRIKRHDSRDDLRDSRNHPKLRETGAFSVNAVSQRPICPLLTLLLLCATLPFTPMASAAKHPHRTKAIVEIVAGGEVVNAGAPAAGAVVYLKNPISLAIKSYLTGPTGDFHFNNISPQTDYEVWAELNGEQSKHKFISQFSSHTKFDFTLKLEPNGKHKFLGIF